MDALVRAFAYDDDAVVVAADEGDVVDGGVADGGEDSNNEDISSLFGSDPGDEASDMSG